MTIWNLGSINIDRIFRVPRLPRPGETLAALSGEAGLGGKGANQSVAAARGGARVMHVGAVGTDGDEVLRELEGAGVDVTHVARLDMPTGQAVVAVDEAGENAIIILSAANVAQDFDRIRSALQGARKGNVLILQNETNLVAETAELARSLGLRVVYSAAPFDADAARAVLPHVDLLVVNAVEADQLARALGVSARNLPVPEVLITKGAEGALWRGGGDEIAVPAFPVTPVDTTGAGDTFLGFFVAGQDAGMDVRGAMRFAAAAAAIQVTRPGTAAAIPGLHEVRDFLEERLRA